jgi:hypothetical protein
MDQSQPKPRRYRVRLSTLLLLVVIAALLVQLYLQTVGLQRSKVLAEFARAEAEVSRAEAARSRMIAEDALSRARTQALEAQRAAAPTQPETKSDARPKSSP